MNKAQRKLKEKNHFLTDKIFIKAEFILSSPILIGSGESEHSDIDVIRDEPFLKTPQPMIPATSIIGVFRHLFDKIIDENLKTLSDEKAAPFEKEAATNLLNAYYDFWGFTETDAHPSLKHARFMEDKNRWDLTQSALQISDIQLENFPIMQRDSVRIDPRSGTAADQAKFNYEIVEPTDKPIEIVFEINLRNGKTDYKDQFKSFVGHFLQAIENGYIRFGAKTNKGFGVLELVPDSIQVAELKLSKTAGIIQWLTGNIDFSNRIEENGKMRKWTCSDLIGNLKLDLNPRIFEIAADFRIKNSMLVRSYSAEPKEPDVSNIRRNDGYVLPGTSIMGAIRHRAWKIINTIFEKYDEEKATVFYKLFGFAKEEYPPLPDVLKDKYEQNAAKGRVMVEETLIKGKDKSFVDMVQTRIKIDRFTGGTIAGALLQEKALWQTDNESTITLNLKIRDYKDWEAGLFMFILKDLVIGDLPIGGEKSIGRGVLIGNKATITWTGNEPIELNFEPEYGLVVEEDQGKLDELKTFTKAWQDIKESAKKGAAA